MWPIPLSNDGAAVETTHDLALRFANVLAGQARGLAAIAGLQRVNYVVMIFEGGSHSRSLLAA